MLHLHVNSMQLKRKIAPFVFGVSIGLIAGVGFFVFKLNDWFNTLKASRTEQVTVIQQPVKEKPAKSKKKNESPERFKINLGKTKVNYKEVDSLIKSDEDINIATEELLSVKNVKVIRLGDNVSDSDTLAAKLAKVKENSQDLYFIEFWKTPLNAKGYRFSKNKIMLYGFMDVNVLLYELDNAYYIKSSDQVYRIFYGADFRKLERVMDSELLARIN